MGVKGFLKILKENLQVKSYDDFNGKKIDIDGNLWIHQILNALNNNFNNFTEKEM